METLEEALDECAKFAKENFAYFELGWGYFGGTWEMRFYFPREENVHEQREVRAPASTKLAAVRAALWKAKEYVRCRKEGVCEVCDAKVVETEPPRCEKHKFPWNGDSEDLPPLKSIHLEP